MWGNSVKRFGLIALATDLTIEGDAARLMPPGTQLHVTRIQFDNPTTPENLKLTGPRLRAAADLILPGVELEGIIFGCTSASAHLRGDLAELTGNRAPTDGPAGSAARAFAALGARRVGLATPYLEETTDIVARFFESNGIGVVARHSMGYADDRDMALVTPDQIAAAARAADRPEAEAIFLSCTALPALGQLEALEAEHGKPVVCANQALFWSMLDRARVAAKGPGMLFEKRTW